MAHYEKISEEQFKKDVEWLENGYENIVIPTHSTSCSAGSDFKMITKMLIKSGTSVVIPTGIRAIMEDDEVLEVYIRSSLGIKKNLTLKNCVGIIDADYAQADNEGHIFVAIENRGSEDVMLNQGDGFAQGIFKKYIRSDNVADSKKRTGGIGSTGE